MYGNTYYQNLSCFSKLSGVHQADLLAPNLLHRGRKTNAALRLWWRRSTSSPTCKDQSACSRHSPYAPGSLRLVAMRITCRFDVFSSHCAHGLPEVIPAEPFMLTK